MREHSDVLVVGQGPAGHRLVERLRALGHDGTITVLGAGPHPAHQRALLPAALAGPLPRAALTLPALPDDVVVRRGTRVVRLDRGRRVVVDAAGTEHGYSHLVLATGVTTRDPVVSGLGAARGLRGPDDLEALTEVTGDVVVLGAGPHGVEVALALARRAPRTRVELVDPHPHPLAHRLDADAGAVVTSALERYGVTVRTGHRAVAHRSGELVLRGPDGVVVTLPAPTVVLATGAAPATELAARSGLATRTGVRVDDRLTTTDPRVHALGAVAEPPSGRSGDLGAAHAQAEVLARHLDGQGARLRAAGPMSRLRVGDVDVVALGPREPITAVDETVTAADPAGTRHARLDLCDGRIVRAVAVGFPAAAGPLIQHWTADRPLPGARLALLLGTPPATGDDGDLPDDAVVCVCNTVTRGALARAHHDGADSVEAVATATRATTGCGTCRSTVCRLLEAFAEQEVPA